MYPFVCPSIRLLHAGIVAKLLNMESHKEHHAIAHDQDSSFLIPKISAKFQRGHPNGESGTPNRGGVGSHGDFLKPIYRYLRNGANRNS